MTPYFRFLTRKLPLVLPLLVLGGFVSAARGERVVGQRMITPAEAGYTTASIIESGERGGMLDPAGTNFTEAANRAMGLAMETWNAHRWQEGVQRFASIYETQPDSPWAAEAELHVGCYQKYNGQYDEAEERFLSVFKKYPDSPVIRKKVLRYLPHLYYMTGRHQAALDALNLMRSFDLTWQEQQYVENWSRAIAVADQAERGQSQCGARALALAAAWEENRQAGTYGLNVTLDSLANRYPWADAEPSDPDGFSLDDLASLGRGRALQIDFKELMRTTREDGPILAHLKQPATPKFYRSLGRPKTDDRPDPSGHFLVVERATEGFVDVLDPRGGRERWHAHDFRYRWSGAVLMLGGRQAKTGHGLPAEIAAQLRGKCCGSPPPDPEGGCGNDAGGGGMNGPGGGLSGLGGGVISCADCDHYRTPGSGRGSPEYQFGLPFANLLVRDSPIWYAPVKGPSLEVRLAHNRVNSQNMATYTNVNYYPFGNKWSFNLGSFLLETPATNVQIVLPDGKLAQFIKTGADYVPADIRDKDTFAISGGYARLTFDESQTVYLYSTNPANLHLEKIRDRYGAEITLQYDANARLTNAVDAVGRKLAFQYDGGGRVTNVVDLIGRTARFRYDTNGNLVSMVDMGGHETHLGYHGFNWISNITYPNGKVVSLTYTNGLGMGSPYDAPGYAPAGNPAYQITSVDSLSHTTLYRYHAFHEKGPMSVTRIENGQTNAWAYILYPGGTRDLIAADHVDAAFLSGHLASHRWEAREFDASQNLINRYWDNAQVQLSYDSPPTGAVRIGYVYDTNRWVVSEAWSHSNVFYAIWSNVYDGAGNRIRRIDPHGNITHSGFDGDANLVAVTNPLGYVTRMTYDSAGNMTSLVDARNGTSLWMYGSMGLATSIVFADGTAQAMTYDAAGRMSTHRDAAEQILYYQHDAMDRVTRITFPDGTTNESVYSCCGLDRTRDRLGRQTAFSYDILQRLVAVTNALGGRVLFRYGAFDSITNLVTYAGGQERVTRFDYETTGGATRIAARVSPQGWTNQYRYAFRGWLTNRVDAKGQTNSYEYDFLGRLTRIWHGAPTSPAASNVVFQYDTLGRVTTNADWLGTNTFQYDALGQVTQRLSTFAIPGFSGVSFRVTYQHDPVGNVTGRTLTGLAGFTNVISTAFAYDSMNRLASVSDAYASASYTYATGRLSRKTYGNADVTHYGYDLESRLTSLTTSNGASSVQGWCYQYNAMGMITNMTNATASWLYRYDAIYQLTQEVYNATGVTTWVYDEAGNRLRQIMAGATNYSAYNQDDELLWSGPATGVFTVTGYVDPGPGSNKWYNTWVTVGGCNGARVNTNDGTFSVDRVPVHEGSNSLWATARDVSGNVSATQTISFWMESDSLETLFWHDPNGNLTTQMTQQVTTLYSYDRENRLTKVTSNGVTVLECWYDGQGRRLAKREVAGGQTNVTQYAYDGWSVLAVLNGDGQIVEHYTRGLGIAGDIGTIVAETKFSGGAAMNTYYYHNNHRGDVTAVRSTNGMTLATWDYRPFGEDRSSTGSFNPRYQFSSKEWDASVQLGYWGLRFYSADRGMWISRDPLGDLAPKSGSRSLRDIEPYLFPFRYARHSPLTFIDRFGLQADCDCAVREHDNISEEAYGEFGASWGSDRDELWHCFAGCRMAQECGVDAGRIAGLVNELIQASHGGDISNADIENTEYGAEHCSAHDCHTCCVMALANGDLQPTE